MPIALKAPVSLAAVIAAAGGLVTFRGALADEIAAIVALVAILAFTRTAMAFAAEPGEKSQRPGEPR
jgi:hypothetical protein